MCVCDITDMCICCIYTCACTRTGLSKQFVVFNCIWGSVEQPLQYYMLWFVPSWYTVSSLWFQAVHFCTMLPVTYRKNDIGVPLSNCFVKPTHGVGGERERERETRSFCVFSSYTSTPCFKHCYSQTSRRLLSRPGRHLGKPNCTFRLVVVITGQKTSYGFKPM